VKFSERLKFLRNESGYTQVEIGNLLEVSEASIRKYESGQGKPRAKNLEKLAKIFDVSVSYLLGETNIRTSYKIIDIMEQLSESRQENTINYAEGQLAEQKIENKIIHLKNSLVPYEMLTEQALSAGFGEGYTDNLETTTVYWDKKVDYDRAIPIKGDSMEPDFQYGQVALIKYQSIPDYPGQVCAVDNVEIGSGYIKSVTVKEDGLLLQSLNVCEDYNGERLFPDKKVPWEENPRIIGKVVAAFTPINPDEPFFE